MCPPPRPEPLPPPGSHPAAPPQSGGVRGGGLHGLTRRHAARFGMIPATLFWISAILLVYGHLGYPLLIRAWARLRPRPAARGDREPAVSIVVVAHNEAARIEGRIANLLALDYPRERLEIVIASDGSTDETVARARALEEPGVRVVVFSGRRGKPAVLNDVIPECRRDIVVLADARQRFEPGTVRALVGP